MVRITKPALFQLPVQEQVDLFRAIMKNNGVSKMSLEVETEETFLARTLVDLGLFPSTSQVKKNKPRLFRNMVDGETVKVGRFNLTLRLSSVH
jgi:hypothetical protein